MGFDVEFPAIRQAAQHLQGADFQIRHFGTRCKTALDDASSAAGNGPLADVCADLSDSMQVQSDNTGKEIAELWQAVDDAARAYDESDQHAAHGIDAVTFGGHDGHH